MPRASVARENLIRAVLLSGNDTTRHRQPAPASSSHAKTWLTTSASVVHGAFEAGCFAQSATRFAMGGRGAGRLRQYVPVQYNPEAYGQFVDLYALHSWDYARTLALGNSSGYCGMHHVAEDPFSSLVVVDVKECAAKSKE